MNCKSDPATNDSISLLMRCCQTASVTANNLLHALMTAFYNFCYSLVQYTDMQCNQAHRSELDAD